MRIGIFLECPPSNGGAFQQSFSTIQLLMQECTSKHEFIVFTQHEQTHRKLAEHGIHAIRFKHAVFFRLLDRWSATGLGGAILTRLRWLGFARLGRNLDALLDDHRIDLVILNDTGDVALRIGDHPFIITVHDLDHREHPEFPESFKDRLFEREERWNSETLVRAIAVITNSIYISRLIFKIYKVSPKRIIQLPFVPSHTVRQRAAGQLFQTAHQIQEKYHLAQPYIFYPAYFLPHKNHLYILEAIRELERNNGILLHAVFCGDDPVNHRQLVEKQARALALTERVRFLGLVSDEDIPGLYEGALAVVVPSYFGPTNLQPVEAVALARPVICSDLTGCREQMGDAALYCDLSDPKSLAGQLAKVIKDPILRQTLLTAGQKLAGQLAMPSYYRSLSPVLEDFDYIRRRWASPENEKSQLID